VLCCTPDDRPSTACCSLSTWLPAPVAAASLGLTHQRRLEEIYHLLSPQDVDSTVALQVRIGPGLQQSGGHIVASRAGVLRAAPGGKLWLDGRQKRCGCWQAHIAICLSMAGSHDEARQQAQQVVGPGSCRGRMAWQAPLRRPCDVLQLHAGGGRAGRGHDPGEARRHLQRGRQRSFHDCICSCCAATRQRRARRWWARSPKSMARPSAWSTMDLSCRT